MPAQVLTEPFPATRTRCTVQAEWVTSSKGFAALAPEWRILLAESGVENAFLTFEWMFTWWRHYGRGHKLALMVARADGQYRTRRPNPVPRSRVRGGMTPKAPLRDAERGPASARALG